MASLTNGLCLVVRVNLDSNLAQARKNPGDLKGLFAPQIPQTLISV